MTTPWTFDPNNYSTRMLCEGIFQRHRDAIQIQKPHVAVAKLVVIIEAALELSNRHGFSAMSLRDLAKKAGVSMGGLYSYFDSKDTLLSMILSQVSDTAIEVLTSPPPEFLKNPQEHLCWIVETHIRLTEAMQPWFVFAFMEAKSFPAHAKRQATDSEVATESLFVDILERGERAGVFSVGNARLTASLIKPLLQDWYIKRSKYRKRKTSIEDYIASVSRFIQGAISI